MIFRAMRRGVALLFALFLSIIRFWLLRLRGPITLERRAMWGQQTARLILACVGIKCRVEGTPATQGLVVANHLSIIDVLILSADMPCFFVAKIEVGAFSFFGEAARSSGTIFLDRSSLESAMSVADQMIERFKLQIPVLLFPEGTSTDGLALLPFHPRLIDPATSTGTQITTATMLYVLEDGTPEKDICWWGDESFGAHLLKILGIAGFTAIVRFGEPRIYNDRRAAADGTRAEIAATREQMKKDRG